MRRIMHAAVGAVLLGTLAAGSVLAAKPDLFIIDIGTQEFEDDQEAFFSDACGFPIDFEGSGHILFHVFNDNPSLIEIHNFRLFETFTANGKTVEVRPDSGPDVIRVGQDGDVYLAIVGRSVTGTGVIGRTLINLSTGEFVSAHGHDLGDFISGLCTALAP